MKAEIKSRMSPDVELETYRPEDPEDVEVFIELEIGALGERGADLFGITVMTPAALGRKVEADGPTTGRHLLIVPRWEWPLVERALERLFENQHAETPRKLSEVLARYGHWEFEDYRPYQG